MKLAPQPLRKSAPVKSAARVLDILELFANERQPLSLKQVLGALHYPQSSATFLMKSLTTLGYLNYDRKARTYFPTFKVALLGEWLHDLVDDRIQSALRKIQEDTGETVMLAAQNDLYVQYLEVLDSSQAMRFHVEKGSLIPLTRTSLGWMLLSIRTPDEVEQICRQINSRSAQNAQVDIPSFQKELEGVRKRGYSYVPNLPMASGGCVSVLVPGSGETPMVIGTGGLVDRLDANLDVIVGSMRKHMASLGPARPRRARTISP